MMDRSAHRMARLCGLLKRLVRDTGGNVIILMTAALIPMAGMVGGGVDITRMYILKTRMQHACDAGTLAGRRAMGGGTWAYNNYYSRTQANKFFDANFETGSYGSSDLTREFTESAGKVTGTVSAVLPMTLMRIFGKTTETIAVTCDAEMRLPNTDVMFVLDTTGSMGDTPSGDSQTKLASLKVAVKCFYEIVARLDTDAVCTTGTPSGGTGTSVQIRFGFVPYATNVNVGRLLKPEWFADSWMYQTREAMYGNSSSWTWVQRGQSVVTRTELVSVTNVPQNQCTTQNAAGSGYNSSADSYSSNNNVKTNLTKTVTSTSWTSASNGTCNGNRQWVETVYDKTYGRAFQQWRYRKSAVTVGLLKNGTSWNSSFQWPIGDQATNRTITWGGCVEERQTLSQSSYSPIPSGAKDLDIDSTPNSGDATTQWGMVLPNLIYTRYDGNYRTLDTVYSSDDISSDEYYACPQEAKKLQEWPVANNFDDYVDGLRADGNTYHDIGLIWGGRLMSPTGIFASENAYTLQGGEIERHMIFMTDGDACTGTNNYTAYGVNWYDRRQTDPNNAPTDGCTTTGTLTAQVNARTEALCTAIKNKNITLWVITFGQVASSTVTRMTNCASSGRYFSANNAAQLQTTFKSIADQISQLRLTK